MIHTLATVFAIFLLGASVPPAVAGEDTLSGRWVGAADLWGRPLVVELELDGEAGTLDAYGEAPLSFDARVLAGGQISVLAQGEDGLRLKLQIGKVAYDFEGRQVGDVLSGQLQGDGPASWLRCIRVPRIEAADLDRLVGLYEGDGQRVVVTWREYGGLRAVDLDSGEGSSLIAVDERSFLTHRQLLDQDAAQPEYRFPKDESGAIVALVRGPWADPATLDRRDAFSQQQFRFLSGGVELAGTLLIPPEKRPVPAVVLVHGSGPIYRTALLQRAVLFVESGFAAFIYDKRGTGASGGERRGDDFETLTGDVRAAVETARRHPAVDAKRVGLQGHSQAGFLIPVVAAEDSSIAFAIVVNGGGIRPGEQSLYDKENDLIRAGFDDREREEALGLMQRLYAYFRDRDGDRVALERDYLAAKPQSWFATTDLPDLPGIPSWESPPAEMLAYAEELLFDPVPYQRRMLQPVLVLLGERDETVPAQVVGPVWRESLRSSGNSEFLIETISGANHGMRMVAGEHAGELSPDYYRLHREWLGTLFDRVARPR